MFEIGKLTRLPLGYVGESNSRTISIDISEWLKEFPDALVMIQVIRPVDRYKYPAAYTLADGVLHWTVDGAELIHAGKGLAQISLYDPDTKREYKSRVVGTVVAESLDGFNEIELEDSDPANKWVNQVLEAADDAKASAEQAAESVETIGVKLESAAREFVARDLRRSYDGTTRLPESMFINGTVTLTTTSANYGKVTTGVKYMVVTPELQHYDMDITVAATKYPYTVRVVLFNADGSEVLNANSFKKEEQVIPAGSYWRMIITKSGVTSGTANISEHVDAVQVLPTYHTPNTTISAGTINAMLKIAEPYFDWAYDLDTDSPLIYLGAESDNSLWYTGMSPVLSSNGVPQYSINCAGFANVLLQGVPLEESRYMRGPDWINRKSIWGYAYDKTARMGDFHTTVFEGDPTEFNNLGSVFTYDMFRYAEQHGFAYLINDDCSNVRPGDLLFSADIKEYPNRYRGISHCAICLNVAGRKQEGSTGSYLASVIHATEAKRFLPEDPSANNIPVGIIISNAGLGPGSNYKYGARFPLGDASDCRPTVAARGSEQHMTGNGLRRIDLGNVERGIYTCIIKGKCAMPPMFGMTWETGKETLVGTVRIDDSTCVVTRYLTAGCALFVREHTTNAGQADGFRVESVTVYRGYASPDATAPDADVETRLAAIEAALRDAQSQKVEG